MAQPLTGGVVRGRPKARSVIKDARSHGSASKRQLRARLAAAGLDRQALVQHAGALLDMLVEEAGARRPESLPPGQTRRARQASRSAAAAADLGPVLCSRRYAVVPIERATQAAPASYVAMKPAASEDPASVVAKTDHTANEAQALTAASDQLITSGHLVKTVTLAQALGVQRQAITAALKAHRMFAFRRGKDEWVPAFYADAALDRRRLEQVTRALGDLPAATKWTFFTQPRASLGALTPLAALARGRLGDVLAAARAEAER